MSPSRLALFCAFILVTMSSATSATQLRDGRLFDPGASMTSPASGAPEQTAVIAPLIGQWDVELELYKGDAVHSTTGIAEFTFMNRGHGVMERFHAGDFDGQGHALETIMFMGYSAPNQDWSVGIANSFAENIIVFSNGAATDKALSVNTVLRVGGAAALTRYRLTLDGIGEADASRFVMTLSQAPLDAEFEPVWQRTYKRRQASAEFMVREAGHGSPAPDRVDASAQFDFLVGVWDETQEMKFPNGQTAKWPSSGSAVYTLNGHAIMEFTSYDIDPNLPDAATCIVRIYNRVMRRWECMFVTNRFNNVLYFGGVKEGDDIVLHQFAADNAGGQFSYWIFHDIEADSYGWYANTSRDRGATFDKTWIIKGTRKSH